MTWVKVCGLSRQVEVAAAVDAGADAVGFVSVPGSPRYVDLDRIAELAAGVPAVRVLLTTDLDPDKLLQTARRAGVDAVQPYGKGAVVGVETAITAGFMVLQPLRIGLGATTADPIAGAVPLFDTHRRDKYGGTGETFDWSLLSGREDRFVVAGGLGPDNVHDLVEMIDPWGVDASSLLESAPGVKDVGKVSAFVEEAKRT